MEIETKTNTNALGSSLIAASGAGSTDFDVEKMSTGLANAEVVVSRYALTSKQEEDELKLSAWGSLKSALSGLNGYLTPLASESTLLQRTITSSDESVFTATADESAAAGSYSVEVTNLAQSNSLYSASYTNLTDTIGTGNLNFSFGTVTVDGSGDPTAFTQNGDKASATVTVTDGSLEGIRDAVNDADFGVLASIVNDGSGYRITFTSTETGAASGIQITADAALSALSFNTTESDLTQSRAGQNAAIKVNGLDISSASNTVTDVISGVTLNLSKSDSGVSKTLTIAHDTASLKNAVSNFVDDYNAMKNVLDEFGGENGDLNGDSMVRGLKSQLRSLTSMPVSQLSGAYTSLTSVGIEFDSSGNLTLNEDALDAVMSNSYSSIGALFVAKGEPTDSQVTFNELSGDTKAGSYAVNLTALATKATKTVGTTVDSLTVDSTNETLLVRVDGVLSQGITLTNKTYSSGAELAAEIQSKINGDNNLQEYDLSVSVTYNGSNFEITSNRYGSASGVEIVAVDGDGGAAAIGLQVEAEVNGIDVAGTINGEAATGSGQYLTSSSGDSKDLKLRISGGVTGDRGTVSVSRGVADQLSSFIGNYIDTDGMIEGREDTLNDKLESYTLQSEKLDAKYESLLARYRSQFSILNGLLGSLDQQRDWMTATFESM